MSDDNTLESYYVSLAATAAYNRFWNESFRITRFAVAAIPAVDNAKQLSGELHPLEVRRQLLRLTDENILTRLVDNFQCFIVEIIASAITENPKMMSGHKIESGIVFASTNLDELKSSVVEHMATKFSYMNVVDLDIELRSRYGFSLFPRKLSQLRVRRIIEIRNLIVHGRGRINNKFIASVGAKFDRLGDLVALGRTSYIDDYLSRLAEEIDQRAVQKFNLKRAIDA